MCELRDVPGTNFEAFVGDPLIKLVMASDGVTVAEMRQILETARAAICARAAHDVPYLTLVD